MAVDYAARRAELNARRDALSERHRGEKFNPEARAEWASLSAQIDDLDHQEREARDEIEVRMAAIREGQADPSRQESGDGNVTRSGPTLHTRADPWVQDLPQPGAPGAAAEMRSRALSAIDRSESMPDDARQANTRTIESDDDPQGGLATCVIELSRPEYKRAWSKWFADPVTGAQVWTPEERAAVARVRQVMAEHTRAMAIGTGGAGGNMLLPYLDPAWTISGVGSVDPMRQIARVDQTAYNEKRYVTATQVVSSWDPEAQEVSDDSPTLSQPAVTCFKGQTFVPVSVELYEDAATLEVEIRKSFLDSKTQLEANAFTLGTGSAQPRGIVTAVSAVGSSIVTTGTNTIAVSDLFANQSALPPRWRPNAKWAMNLSILNAFRQLPQATGLNFSVVSDATVPPKALGWDIHENSSMDGTLSTGSDLLVLSGDFQQFAIVDRVPSMIEYVPTLFGAAQRPTGQRGFVQHWRVGSDVLVADAFRISNYNV